MTTMTSSRDSRESARPSESRKAEPAFTSHDQNREVELTGIDEVLVGEAGMIDVVDGAGE